MLYLSYYTIFRNITKLRFLSVFYILVKMTIYIIQQKHFICQSPDVCFHPSPGEVSAGWYGIALDVWLFGPSAFRFRSRSRKPISWFFSIAYTDPGCGCVLWGLWTSIYLNSRPSAIITFNMPNIWQTVRNSKTINILYLPEGQSFRPHPPHIDFVAKIQ